MRVGIGILGVQIGDDPRVLAVAQPVVVIDPHTAKCCERLRHHRRSQRARARHIDVTFARDLGVDPPEEWRQDIDQTLFPGGYFKEFISFHKKSKTLVVTDTIINIELDKMPQPWRTATKLSGMYYPRGQIFFGMRLPLLLQGRKAKAAFAKIHAWRPERIMLSHGRCFESHGEEVIRSIFGEAAP